jgi:hypothetical protein
LQLLSVGKLYEYILHCLTLLQDIVQNVHMQRNWIKKRIQEYLAFNNRNSQADFLIETSSQPFSLWIISKHSSREFLLIYTEFITPLWKFHCLSADHWTARPQRALNQSVSVGVAEKAKNENSDMMAKKHFYWFYCGTCLLHY